MARKTRAPKMDEWRVQDDLRSLRTAEDVRRDPARRRAAEQAAKKEMRALEAIVKPSRPPAPHRPRRDEF